MGVITIIIGIIFILGIFSLTEMEISGRGFPIFAFAFGFGLLHGFTPCEHSWPFLVPYSMVTARKVREVLIVATAFCIGIFTSAIINGVIYGGVGWAANSLTNFAETAEDIVPRITGAILIIFGAILLWKPTIFHGGHERGNKDINKH
jgi:ABC-type nickel/cobalt efflux system permease component RcnA